ncbi:MAG: DAK2 domain-containing protein, partial [Clostridia bacterium]|nr:DAK2 domain-containing protein [Clostridia bacterium]
MVSKAMNAAQLTVFMQGALEHLAANREALNALNVFPVPDGDTGINMYLTISSAVKNISVDNAGHIGKTCGDFSMGALMGARGNSGVILSQIFRGFAQSLAKNHKEVTTRQFVNALQKGVDLSYKSVMKPVEGTILTVFKDLTAGAKAYVDGGGEDMFEMLKAALTSGEKSLANTPNLLPALKQAGVVDAGGKGILIIIEGGYLAVTGQTVVADADFTKNTGIDSKTMTVVSDDIEFGFCTELIIRGKHLPVDLIRNYYDKNIKGDCLLVVGTDELVKVHFHSNEPWKILQYAAKQGLICDIKIDNMRFQHSQQVLKNNQAETSAEPDQEVSVETEVKTAPQQNCGVLAVCSGDGLATVFEKMGAVVLSGGQTMNPSAEELLKAIDKINAQEIIVLPNNSNIILAAEQAAKLTKQKIVIVPSKFVTQGISAMLTF